MLTFIIWWVFLLILGIGYMPLTSLLFHNYRDRGWLFSKAIGLAVSGFMVWVLVCSKIVPFTAVTCLAVTAFSLCLNALLLKIRQKKGDTNYLGLKSKWRLIVREEVVFFLVFLVWTYLAGFHPAAYGTEKFMDYGFMAAMMRSKTLPAEDLWYAGKTMNYYYGGQYYAVFLTKLTGTKVAETYNVARTMVAAFAFVLPFALVEQLWCDRIRRVRKGKTNAAAAAGLLAGAAVSLCGNMHYIIIGKLYPLAQKLALIPKDKYTYWFPNSTRYLGHYPELSDRTIHEFPAYSFVLGDLHAHVVNIMYVLTVLGILYAWVKTAVRPHKKAGSIGLRQEFFSLHAVVLGFFIGIFQWTNYWDFLIYFVICTAVVFYRLIRIYGHQWARVFSRTILQSIVVYGIGFIAALPFQLTFKTMVSGVALAKNHSIFYQWTVLWGLPFILCLLFIGGLAVCYVRAAGKKIVKYNVFDHVNCYDMFVVILSLCAMGLVVLTEIVYVRDIYEETSARSNTMFKLTYQAFMLFGISMPYILWRFLTAVPKKTRAAGVMGLVCLLSTLGYFGNASVAWFKNFWDVKQFQGLDATAFLEQDFPEDASAIRWLNDTIAAGHPVVLEVNGSSYSDTERVSAMTGLPTVVGWRTHEWLWRGSPEQVDQRAADVKTIYTSSEREKIQELIDQYQIAYIFVGSQERAEIKELNNEMLRSLGKIVFEDKGSYIVSVSPES